MKRTLLLALVLCSFLAFAAPLGIYQHGTVVRMHMGDCALLHRGFMATFGPPQQAQMVESCPEYTLVADKVVFVVVGKSSNQLMPLAEVIDFRINKNELAVRVDDSRHESKFVIREMALRSQWELLQKHIEDQLNDPRRPVDASLALRNRE